MWRFNGYFNDGFEKSSNLTQEGLRNYFIEKSFVFVLVATCLINHHKSHSSCDSESDSEEQSQLQSIGRIFTLATSLLGINLFFHGFVRFKDSTDRWIMKWPPLKPCFRDYISFGVSRIIIYLCMIGSYILIAISRPGSTDYFQVIAGQPKFRKFSLLVCLDCSSWMWRWRIFEWTSTLESLPIKYGTIDWFEWSFNWLEHILATDLETLSILVCLRPSLSYW